jgi:hypothetical protein
LVLKLYHYRLGGAGRLSWIGGYVSAAALLSVIAVLCLKETSKADLQKIA